MLEKSSDQADELHSSVYPTILFNMFSRAATTFFYASVAFGLLAAATPNPGEKRWGTPTKTVTVTQPNPVPTSVSQCSTGPVQCCNSVQSVSGDHACRHLQPCSRSLLYNLQASSPKVADLLDLLEVVVQGVDVLVGVTCSPISVIGVGGSSCSAHPVCCENNNFVRTHWQVTCITRPADYFLLYRMASSPLAVSPSASERRLPIVAVSSVLRQSCRRVSSLHTGTRSLPA